MLHLKIKAGTGGEDAKLLASDLSDIYLKAAKSNNFEIVNSVRMDSHTDLYL